jgi:hypothetical protein
VAQIRSPRRRTTGVAGKMALGDPFTAIRRLRASILGRVDVSPVTAGRPSCSNREWVLTAEARPAYLGALGIVSVGRAILDAARAHATVGGPSVIEHQRHQLAALGPEAVRLVRGPGDALAGLDRRLLGSDARHAAPLPPDRSRRCRSAPDARRSSRPVGSEAWPPAGDRLPGAPSPARLGTPHGGAEPNTINAVALTSGRSASPTAPRRRRPR